MQNEYELYDIETDEVASEGLILESEVKQLNDELIKKGSTLRWVKKVDFFVVRNSPTDPRKFGCNGEPTHDGTKWNSPNGNWVRLPTSWRNDITFENSPVKIRGIIPIRGI